VALHFGHSECPGRCPRRARGPGSGPPARRPGRAPGRAPDRWITQKMLCLAGNTGRALRLEDRIGPQIERRHGTY